MRLTASLQCEACSQPSPQLHAVDPPVQKRANDCALLSADREPLFQVTAGSFFSQTNVFQVFCRLEFSYLVEDIGAI